MIHSIKIDRLIIFFFILNAIRNILLFVSLDSVASDVFYLIYITLGCIILLNLYAQIQNPIRVTKFFIASIILIITLLVILLNYGFNSWMDKEYIPAIISFFLTVSFLISSKNIIISQNTIRWCYFSFIMQAFVAIICAHLPGSYEYGALVLNIGNPNQTSIILWSAFVSCFLFWTKHKPGKAQTAGLWILMVATMILIYKTESRTGFVSCIICICGYFWINGRKGNRKLPHIICNGILCFPLILPIIILTMLKLFPEKVKVLTHVLLSGREQIWENICKEFFLNPFANHITSSPYYSYVMMNNQETLKAWGAHNGVLAIQWNWGIIVTILIIYLLFYNLNELNNNAEINSNTKMVYLVVISTFFSLVFEEGMIMGNVCTSIMLPLFFIIGRSEAYTNDIKIKDDYNE